MDLQLKAADQKRILQIFKDQPDVSISSVVLVNQLIYLSPVVILAHLSTLTTQGKIRRVSHGTYILNQKTRGKKRKD
jgi:predicted transcriptional regulator of viral defense system